MGCYLTALLTALLGWALPALTPGAVVERELKANEAHRYAIELRAGEYFQAVVEQRGVDVRLSVIDPEGGTALELDGPTADNGPEPVAFVAGAGGVHRLVVQAGRRVTWPARYELRVEAQRTPGPADRQRVEAVRATSEACRMGGSTEEKARAALAAHAKALSAWEAVGDRRMQAWTQAMVGYVSAAFLDRFADAHEHFQRGLLAARDSGDVFAQATLLVNLGSSYRGLGRFEDARSSLEEALAIQRAAHRREGEGRVLNSLGYLFLAAGDPEHALDTQHEALRLLEHGDPRLYAITQTNVGNSYLRLGELDLAVEQFQRALPALQEPRRRARVITLMGLAQFRQGDLPRARAAYDEALGLFRTVGNRLMEAETHLRLAELHREGGDLPVALAEADAALAVMRSSQDPLGESAALCERGESQRRMGVVASAGEAFGQALRLAQPRSVAHALCAEAGLARVARDRGDLARARTHAEKAVEIAESLRAAVTSPRWRAGALASNQALYELLIEIRMRQHAAAPAAGHEVAALEVSERARARSLLELLGEGPVDVREGVDPRLLEEERGLRVRLNTLAESQEEAMARGGTQRAEAVGREIAALAGPMADVESRIRRASPRHAALSDPQPLTVGEIQAEVLDADTVLLEYALGPTESYLWAVSQDRVTSYRLAPRAEIERAADRLHALMNARGAGPADAEHAAWREAAAEVARLVLPSATREVLNRGRVLVIAPGALQYVPFAALPMPAESGDRGDLIAALEVVSAPSASVLASLRRGGRPRRTATREVAVFADPVYDANDPRVARSRPAKAEPIRVASRRTSGENGVLARLPFSRQEANAIAALAPRGASLLALGFDASRAAATSDALADYRIVHFATHGVLNTQQAELSGVVLSLVDHRGHRQDGFLRLHDIYNLRLGADLVVLSGCQTGLGKDMRGEGLVGLTRGFMYAGAPRVVASLWQVDDLATAELMKRFYRAMFVQKLSPAAALRAAQQELAATRQWRAPYYWAAFVLHGDWR